MQQGCGLRAAVSRFSYCCVCLDRESASRFHGVRQVKVIEKTDQFRRFGGPIQLASNALSTLQAIDPAFFERVMEHFTFTGVRTNGIKDGIRTEW